MDSEILAKIIRGETLESLHRGHLIIVDGNGETLAQIGDPSTVTFLRSSAKPFQVLPFLLSGGAEHFGFSDDEIALACGSHSGEKFHLETAAEMLEKCGLSEQDLRCGSHLPFSEEVANSMIRADNLPTQLHNNCSGKHSAMLAFAKYIGADLTTYEEFNHPIQQQILKIVEQFCEYEDVKLAVDGCAAPNFAVPISAMAKSFAKLVFPPQTFDEKLKNACQRIVSAMMNFPQNVGGTERLDTLVMQELNGQIICKIGAEGVWLAGILPSEKYKSGLGIAFKIEDGDDKRARAVVVIELLRQLELLDNKQLAEYSPIAMTNRRGDIVGQIEADFKLKLR
jgi:L-asparaginase II